MRSGFPTSSEAPRGWGGWVDVSRDGCVCWGGVHGTAPLFRVPLGTASFTLSEELKPRMPRAVHFVSLSAPFLETSFGRAADGGLRIRPISNHSVVFVL